MHYSYVSTKWAEVLVGEMAAKTKDVHSGKKGVDGWRCLIF